LISTKFSEGAILIFLPGWDQIKELNELLFEDRFQIGIRDPSRLTFGFFSILFYFTFFSNLNFI